MSFVPVLSAELYDAGLTDIVIQLKQAGTNFGGPVTANISEIGDGLYEILVSDLEASVPEYDPDEFVGYIEWSSPSGGNFYRESLQPVINQTVINIPSASSDPEKCVVYFYLKAEDSVSVANIKFIATLNTHNNVPAKIGTKIITRRSYVGKTSDETDEIHGPGFGVLSIDRNGLIVPEGSTWTLRFPSFKGLEFKLDIGADTDLLDISTLIT